MMRTLRLNSSLMVTLQLHDFIALKLRKEEVTVAMIKEDQFFHQRHIFIKMANPLLILLRVAVSNHPHMDKIGLMVLMVDYHRRMYMPEKNDEDYFPLVPKL